MSTEIEAYASASLPDRWNYAQAMASAGELVPKGMRTNNVPDAGKIFFTFETGSMLNIHPVAAIQGVNVIEGQPTLSPALMSAVIRRAGHLIRVTTEGQLADLSLSATAVLVRKDDPDHPFTVTWTIERARRAGLLQVVSGAVQARSRSGHAGPWEKYTEAMLKARAISEVCREGGTDALMGAVYVPEELGGEVNELGEMIAEAPPAAERRPAPRAEDFQPIALANLAPETVVVAEAPAEEPQLETDQDIVEVYRLNEITTVIEAQQAYLKARQNGHLDRPVDGLPLGEWLTRLGEGMKAAQQQVDLQTGEVYGDNATSRQDPDENREAS